MNSLEGISIQNIFCEDVREEKGDKQTLIGCFTKSRIVLEGTVVLPALVCVVMIRTPSAYALEGATLTLSNSDAEQDIEVDLSDHLPPREELTDAQLKETESSGIFRAMFRIHNLAVQPGTTISSSIKLGEDRITGNALNFVQAVAGDSATST